ncbi:MAG: metallophosphoesterase family protein [Tannerellaceae bacterium]|jgi:hypothetical protein|nr:metallophosphoesterase family protein [Tannerellaceae bacterium]
MKLRNVLFVFLCSIAVTSFVAAEGGERPELKFGKNGKFKIMQMTDLHYEYSLKHGKPEHTLELVEKAIKVVQPDLIMLTGDIVSLFATPQEERTPQLTLQAWSDIIRLLEASKIPWAVTFGNHDREFLLTNREIIEFLQQHPHNLTVNGPENISGNGNYVLEVASSKQPGKTAAALYCFDSKSQDKWISYDQINWYGEQSRSLTAQNGGEPLPALAFFHIPLREYWDIFKKPGTIGIQDEDVCAQDINSGLLAAFYDQKDVMGMFVGHDHNNNYIGCLHNICLAYGYTSGCQAYGEYGRGVRVIELTEGKRTFTTWLLKLFNCVHTQRSWSPVEEIKPEYLVTYPDSFVKE